MNAKYLGLYVFLCNLVAGVLAAPPSPLPTTTYTTKYLNPFINGSWDFSIQTPIVVSIFGDTFGGANGNAIVMGSWFVTLIALYWLRHDDVVVPFFMFTLMTNIAFWTPGLVPPEWNIYLVALCIFLPVAAIFYVYITER